MNYYDRKRLRRWGTTLSEENLIRFFVHRDGRATKALIEDTLGLNTYKAQVMLADMVSRGVLRDEGDALALVKQVPNPLDG